MSVLASEQPTSQQQPAEDATPHWFFTSNNLTSVGERREEAKRAQVIATLSELFPETPEAELRAAIAAGGDLTTIVDRLLASQFAEPEAPMAAASSSAGGASSSSSSSSGAGPSARPDAMASDDNDAGGSADGPKRRVRFAPKLVEQMTIEEEPAGDGRRAAQPNGAGSGGGGGGGGMSRLSDEELSDQMASSGIHDEPTAGSARRAARGGSSIGGVSIDALLQGGATLEDLRSQHPLALARGALRVAAKIIKTANDIEPGYLRDTIVTFFVIEVHQLGIRWEVRRRYSEFHSFHELLTLQWTDLPTLPPKLLLSQDSEDVAQRMIDLDAYLRELLASPAVALSPLVCTFLDATDVQSFRAQILPQMIAQHEQSRVSQMETEASSGPGGPPTVVPTAEEAPNGW